MRPLPRPVLTLACAGLLLAVAIGAAWSLRAPDPRTRAAWGAAPLVLPAGETTLHEIYVPACAVRAIRVHAAPGAGGAIAAWWSPVAGSGPPRTSTDPTRVELPAGGTVDVPIAPVQARTRGVLALTAATSIALDPPRPFTVLAEDATRLGLLPCAIGPAWTTWLLGAAVLGHVLALGWLVAGIAVARGTWPSGHGPALAAVITASTVIVYMVLVPPYEAPDELAHLQYARFVATTGGLPRERPAPTSEWRDSAYEWVQQPGYYVAAAALLHVAGAPGTAPTPERHPQSRVMGGPDVNIHRHPDRASPAGARQNLWTLRLLSLACALATAWCAAKLVALATGDARLALAAAAALALVPQWAAVMGSVSTDPPATAAAAAATWLMARALHRPPGWRAGLLLGAATGMALASKVTTVFLLPMVAVVCLAEARRGGWRSSARVAVASAAGLVLTAAWIPLRAWLVFGDPLARAFKREVLAQGGFVVTEGPPVFSRAFADEWVRLVFEPFWARFGSLGAGPLPGTRLWWVYAAATLLLVLAWLTGTGRAFAELIGRVARRGPTRPEVWTRVVCAVGVATGLALWAWINLVPQEDVIVHWTPRHVLPLTAPWLAVAAAGFQAMAARLSPPLRAPMRPVAATGLLALAMAGLAVARSVILGFHFGY